MTTTSRGAAPQGNGSTFRAVALPSEHGGWGLTAEPALLGLLIKPSLAGVLLGVAAAVAFLLRTPMKIVLVDSWRHRTLERTRLAARVTLVESLLLVALVTMAVIAADAAFWWPAAVAAPLVAVELWFDMRSRSRRLTPELAGAVGISSVAAMIVLAAGADVRVAVGAWLILAARSITAIPYVRAQIARLRYHPTSGVSLAVADLTAAAIAVVAVAIDTAFIAGAAAVGAVIAIQRLSTAHEVPPPKVLGLRQMALGFGVVAVTALGVHLS
jgi:hypothetical protein